MRRAVVELRAACRPIGSLVKDSAVSSKTSAMTRTALTVRRTYDEREKRFRRRRWSRSFDTGAAGKGRHAPADVPAAQGLQVLRGEDRRHQLQGHEAADVVRPREGEDRAATHFGHMRDASTKVAHGDHARATARDADRKSVV